MAGWSMLDDGVVVDFANSPQKLKPDGFLLDLEPVSERRGAEVEGEVDTSVIGGLSDEVRCCFDRFLGEFLKEICGQICIRPIPPMLGNGQRVDLYKLFMVVKEKGGYDAVCKSRLWDLVGEESGLGMSIGSSVKLIYSKYLSAFDTWLKKVADSKVPECGLVDDRVNFGRRLLELQTEVEGLLSGHAEEEVGEEFGSEDDYPDGRKLCDTNRVKGMNPECDTNSVNDMNTESNEAKKVQNGGHLDLDMSDHRMNESILGNSCNNNDAMEALEEFDGGKLSAKRAVDVSDVVKSAPGLSSGGKKCDNDDDVLKLDPSSVHKESSGHKRKRESMWEMLSWVTGIAKNPCDPVVGSIPEKSKWKSHSHQEIWKQVLSFREAVILRRGFESSSEQPSWQGQKMHPCIYDDHLGATYNLRERLKFDKGGKSTSAVRSSSDSPTGTQGDSERSPSPHTEDRAEKQLLDSSAAHSGLDRFGRVRIPLGPNHQAEVPEWTGMTYESDSKWLGTRIWPSEKVNSKFLIERDPIGKGRQDSCGCQVQGSVECVRFHITEKRAKVKLELGVAFYQWNLDKVGEEVRHLWTEEEEKLFKDVVRSNPPSHERYFWDHIFRSFPKKSREDLVGYYFNVFLLQRRGYQNRHTPNNIDSDDDESESGPLRNVFGHQTQKSRSSILLSPKKPQSKGR